MSRFIALLQFLLALSGCSVGGTTYSNRIDSDQEQLHSKARVQDGVARFDCRASDSGLCYYTLYAAACARTNCNDAPLRRFSVARDQSRQFAGLAGFHPCVDTTNTALGPDCKPRAAAAKH